MVLEMEDVDENILKAGVETNSTVTIQKVDENSWYYSLSVLNILKKLGRCEKKKNGRRLHCEGNMDETKNEWKL